MNRTTLIGIVVACLVTGTASAQPSAPVVTRTDVIYGRVEGSALLANISYPGRPGAEAGDHLGPRRAVASRESRRRQQHQGGAVGRVRLLRDVDRLPAGGRLTGAGAVSRSAVRHPLAPCARGRVPHRSRARLSDRTVGRRPDGVADGDPRRGQLPARRRLGEGAQRRSRRDQRRRHLRTELAVVGQPVDTGHGQRRRGALARIADRRTSARPTSRSWSSTRTTTSRCRCSRPWTWPRS